MMKLTTNKPTSPTKEQVFAMRREAGLTQAQAAERVYASSRRAWQDWERGINKMPVAYFELWKLQDKLKLFTV